jgi:hypothetical protein
LEEKQMSLSLQTSALDSLKSTSATCVSPPVLLGTANDDPDYLPTVHSQCLFLTYSFVFVSYFVHSSDYDCAFLDAFRKIAKSDY